MGRRFRLVGCAVLAMALGACVAHAAEWRYAKKYTSTRHIKAIDFYDSIAHRVHHLHLQNRLSAERQTVCLADGDWVDYRRLLPHVRDGGFDGIACIEFTAGITPAAGETFALEDVIGNAVSDRDFVQLVWGT